MIILRQKEFGRLVGKAKTNVNSFFTGGNKKVNKKFIRDFRINEVLNNEILPNSRDRAIGEYKYGSKFVRGIHSPHTNFKDAALKVSRGSDNAYNTHLEAKNPNRPISDYQKVTKYMKPNRYRNEIPHNTSDIDKKILLKR